MIAFSPIDNLADSRWRAFLCTNEQQHYVCIGFVNKL